MRFRAAFILASAFFAFSTPAQAGKAGCQFELVTLPDARFKEVTQEFALLFDQVIKNGGSKAGPLITQLVYLAESSPKIRETLAGLQDKTDTLFNTRKGSTFVDVGFMVQVDDPYAQDKRELQPEDSDLMMMLLNGTFQAVGPEFTVDRGKEEKVIVNFGGLHVQVQNHKLKDRLTPPVNDFLIAALTVIAISDPQDPNGELDQLPGAMLTTWDRLAVLTEYLRTLVRTTVSGHFPSVNVAIEQMTPENLDTFKQVLLPGNK